MKWNVWARKITSRGQSQVKGQKVAIYQRNWKERHGWRGESQDLSARGQGDHGEPMGHVSQGKGCYSKHEGKPLRAESREVISS